MSYEHWKPIDLRPHAWGPAPTKRYPGRQRCAYCSTTWASGLRGELCPANSDYELRFTVGPDRVEVRVWLAGDVDHDPAAVVETPHAVYAWPPRTTPGTRLSRDFLRGFGVAAATLDPWLAAGQEPPPSTPPVPRNVIDLQPHIARRRV